MADNLTLARVYDSLKSTTKEIENFKRYLQSKPSADNGHQYLAPIEQQLNSLVSSINSTNEVLINFEGLGGIKPLDIDPALQKRIQIAIEAIMLDEAVMLEPSIESGGALVVALNAIEQFQSVLRNIASKELPTNVKRKEKGSEIR